MKEINEAREEVDPKKEDEDYDEPDDPQLMGDSNARHSGPSR